MRGFVANTDHDWFAFLRERQPHEEVNFWQPSGSDVFRALQPGEPLLFRLKSPHNAIGGSGLFARHEIVPAFDRGYVTVTPDFRFEVSGRLRDEYENGRTYYAFQGRVIHLPARADDRPDPELLRWHNETIYERGVA